MSRRTGRCPAARESCESWEPWSTSIGVDVTAGPSIAELTVCAYCGAYSVCAYCGALNSQARDLCIRAAVFVPSAHLHIDLHSASEGRAPRIDHAMAVARNFGSVWSTVPKALVGGMPRQTYLRGFCGIKLARTSGRVNVVLRVIPIILT